MGDDAVGFPPNNLKRSAMAKPYSYENAESPRGWMGQYSFTDFLADGNSTAGVFGFVDEVAEHGSGPPLHTHDDWEAFYVLEGSVKFFLGESSRTLGAGGFAFVPGGEVHGFRVESKPNARYLIMTTPHHTEFYKEITTPSPENEVSDEMLGAAVGKYGITFVGPHPDQE